jgi:hypothetical protein
MIYIGEGSEEASILFNKPWVRAELETGYRPFLWKFTMHVWFPASKTWAHYYEFDDNCYGLWRAFRKAENAVYRLEKHLK